MTLTITRRSLPLIVATPRVASPARIDAALSQEDIVSTFSVSPIFSVSEGDSGSARVTATISRVGGLTRPALIDWSIHPHGSEPASANDFVGAAWPGAQSLEFAPGVSSIEVEWFVAGDTTVEVNEGYELRLSNPRIVGLLGTATSTGSINDDDVAAPPDPDPPSGTDTYLTTDNGDVLTDDAGNPFILETA